MIKAIFFDFDGVLAITEDKHLKAWHMVMDEIKIPREHFKIEKVLGLSDSWMAEDLIKVFNLSYKPEELILKKHEHFVMLTTQKINCPKGRDEFLEFCYKKFVLVVVSSSYRNDVLRLLQNNKIDHFFSHYICFDDTHDHKPLPAPYLSALEKTGVNANEAIVIEDSPAGIQAAVSAGIKVLALSTSITSLEDNSDIVFYDDFASIPAIALTSRT
jgi:HAD superfamily hydrolase (TIGR01509 family)